MLSDDSSSDSETGRFKGHSRSERKVSNNESSRPHRRGNLPDLGRKAENDRPFRRDAERRHDNRGHSDRRRSRDRFELSRRQSPQRRRYSRERSPQRKRSLEKHIHSRDVEEHSSRSKSIIELKQKKDDRPSKRSTPVRKLEEGGRNFREEIRKNIVGNIAKDKSQERDKKIEVRRQESSRDREYSKTKRSICSIEIDRSSREKSLKKSEVKVPVKIKSPIKEKSVSLEKEISRSKSRRYSDKEEEESDLDQPASYYNVMPTKITEPAETIHSLTDSSEDEVKLRARLLNLEKELDRTKKKKSKKHKKKSKNKDNDDAVEVSSTTDIKRKTSDNNKDSEAQMQAAEVSSTQHRRRKESSEEGEISSDNEGNISIDPSDLRHRLKRSTAVPDTSGSPDLRDKLKLRTEVAGPALPPHLDKREKRSPSPNVEGPALPPHLCGERKKMGPTLPAELREVLAKSSDHIKYISSDEDEGIGPLPVGAEKKWTTAHKKLEERALDMKIRSLEGGSRLSDIKAREEWMLELPEAKAKILGLGPRQFRSKEAPDMSDRSSWTDTPHQKSLKAAGLVPVEEATSATLQRDAHQQYLAERDHEHEKAIKKHKKKHKREESLLEIHEKKLKKKKKKEDKEDGSKGRRPFDRDIDLQANRFDEAQKKSIIKKAQHLDSRFSRGEAKYL